MPGNYGRVPDIRRPWDFRGAGDTFGVLTRPEGVSIKTPTTAAPAAYILIAEGDTFPSEPSEPSEPFEPGPLRGLL